MPTLTFASPQEAVNAVINKKTGYYAWDNQKNKISDGLKIENWEKFFEN